jgi:phage tail protein X
MLISLPICLLVLSGCMPTGSMIDEAEDPAFERGRAYLKVGRETEALDQFLSVTRRVTQAPKSHLEVGRLLLSLPGRKDPVAAIYHFKRFLLLEPNTRESPMVEQLIVTAEREIIRKLPGEPYGNYLESLELKEENDRLRSEVADLQARLGSPVSSFNPDPQQLTVPESVNLPAKEVLPDIKPKIPTVYVVQQGDSLYAISLKVYGNASFIDAIFSANRDVLKSKNSLRVGQELRLPPLR